jgi:hypothetical protein
MKTTTAKALLHAALQGRATAFTCIMRPDMDIGITIRTAAIAGQRRMAEQAGRRKQQGSQAPVNPGGTIG